MNKIILFTFLMLFICSNLFATGYNTRNEKYRKQVNEEIKRHHELEVEKARIEVLGRLQQLGSDSITINNHVSSRSTLINKSKIK